MDFRKITSTVLFGFLIISCSDKKEETINSNPLTTHDTGDEEDALETVSFEENATMKNWLTFYQKDNPELDMGSFEMQQTEKLEMMQGSVKGVFDPEFDSVYEPFLVYNPSKTMYIDLDSYHWSPDKDGKPMFEADQEVNLVSLKDKTVRRIGFYGPSHRAEDAFWMTDSVFVVLENNDENQIGFQLYNLMENTVSNYNTTQTLKSVSNAYFETRLNQKGVEVSD